MENEEAIDVTGSLFSLKKQSEGEQSIEKFKEEKEKLKSGFKQWKDENPQQVQMVKDLVKSRPNIPRDSRVKDNTEEMFMWAVYGMELARRDCQAAGDIDIPRISFDIDLQNRGMHFGSQSNPETNEITFGPKPFANEVNKKVNEFNAKSMMDRLKSKINPRNGSLSEEAIIEMVTTGAHEFAHEVFTRKATNTAYDNETQRSRVHEGLAQSIHKGTIIDREHQEMYKKDNYRTQPLTAYDSSTFELMAITWEKRVLKNHLPWAETHIRQYEDRIQNAQEFRRKMSKS